VPLKCGGLEVSIPTTLEKQRLNDDEARGPN
jgi:hypothetical protein